MAFLDVNFFIILVISAATTFFGTIIGGAAFINIPIMIFLGVPPQTAVATQKFGALGLAGAGLYGYEKGGKVNFKLGSILGVFMLLGAILGSYILLWTGDDLIEMTIIVVMAIMLIYVITQKKFGIQKIRKKISTRGWLVGIVVSFLLGIYAGFFGGGLGAMISFLLLGVFGETFLESAGTRKVMSLPAILVSIIIFSINGIIVWSLAVALLIGSSIGSYSGAVYSLKKGDSWVRTLFIVVVSVMLVGLIIF